MKKITKENQKGITLIALVITIIVLLILAGVAVSNMTGNESVMDKAQNAKVATDNANEEEEIRVAVVQAMANNMNGLGEVTAGKLREALNSKYPVADEGDKLKVFANATYTIEKNGTVKNEGETPKGEFSITSFSYTPNTVSIGGTSSEPTVTVTGTPYQGPKYTSSDESKATVNETTGIVTGVASGDVTITVTYKNFQNVDVTETTTVTVSLPADLTTVNSYREFNYTGTVQSLRVASGQKYKLEVWGAQGSYNSTGEGYGGYSRGEYIIPIDINKIYIVVGGQGIEYTGGYNGGGNGVNGTSNNTLGSGGGATHIGIKNGLLSEYSSDYTNQLLIVAGGGGGNPANDVKGGNGGGYEGETGSWNCDSTYGTRGAGGNQSSGGYGASFGKGGNAYDSLNHGWVTGGGGGFFGGGGAYRSKTGCTIAGGGGSGYINTLKLTNAYMYGYNVSTSSAVATKTYSTSNVSSTAISDYAKQGNGYAKITLLSN